MVAVTALIGFVVLALVCVSAFGLLGFVPWLVIYGLFLFVSKRLIRHLDVDAIPHQSRTSPSASTTRQRLRQWRMEHLSSRSKRRTRSRP